MIHSSAYKLFIPGYMGLLNFKVKYSQLYKCPETDFLWEIEMSSFTEVQSSTSIIVSYLKLDNVYSKGSCSRFVQNTCQSYIKCLLQDVSTIRYLH